MNQQTAKPRSSPSISSQTRPRYGIAALCRTADGQTFNELAVGVTSGGCRLAYYSDTVRPPLVHVQLHRPCGNPVEADVKAFTVTEGGKLKIVDCQFERALTDEELAGLI